MSVRVVRLSLTERGLLAARYAEHGNSTRRMRTALREAGAPEVAERLDTLRLVERRFDVDLGEVCHRFARRHRPDTHPIERLVVEYIARPADDQDSGDLLVLLDRLARVRELMDGTLVEASEEA
ncbi:MAG: hypothetical protein WEB88_04510 [Gemmatimonadota bacterium]